MCRSVTQELADRTHSILNDNIEQLIGHQSTDFVYVNMLIVHSMRRIFILAAYFVCYFINIYFRSFDAEKSCKFWYHFLIGILQLHICEAS